MTVTKQYTIQQKYIAFISTLCIRSNVYAILGIISRIKVPMASDLLFTQSFLGIISFMLYAGRAFGGLQMCLRPTQKLKKTLVTASILYAVFIGFIPLAGLIEFKVKLLILVGAFFGGIARSYSSLSYFVLKQYFGQSPIEQKLISIWYSMSYFGDISGILITELFLTTFGMSWESCMIANLGILIFFAMFLHFGLKQVQLVHENSAKNEGMLKQFSKFFCSYFSYLSNILQTVTNINVGILYYTTLMWLPFYFSAIGYQYASSFITIIFPASFMFGNFIYTFFIHNICSLKSTGPINFMLFIFTVFVAFALTRLHESQAQIPIYCALLCILGILISGPEIRMYSTQIDARVTSSYERNMVISINLLLHHIVAASIFFLSGFLLESNIHYLFWLLFGLTIMLALLYGLRVWLFSEEFKISSIDNHEKKDIDNSL